MKKLIMFAVATVMAMNVAQAADDDKKKAPRKGRAGGIQAMIKQLDLTADQKKALAKFNKENKEKGAAARKLKGEERKAAMKKMMKAGSMNGLWKMNQCIPNQPACAALASVRLKVPATISGTKSETPRGIS